MEKFIPQIYKKNLFSINYDKLKELGIKLLIFDLDNTLSLVREKTPQKKIKDFVNKLSNDFKILVASNNTKERVSLFCKDMYVDILYRACKPFNRTSKYLKENNILNNEVAIIGDQMVTDIYLGNRCGYLTILVDPIGEEYLKVSAINQCLEKRIRKRIDFKKGDYYEKK